MDLDTRLRALAPVGTADPEGLARARERVLRGQAVPPSVLDAEAVQAVRRRPRSRRRLWATAPLAAAAAVVAGVLLTAGPPQPAFATWTATPQAPDAGAAALAETSCRSGAPAGTRPRAVLAEQRGVVVLTVLEDRDGPWSTGCVWSRHDQAEGSIAGATEVEPPAPAPGGLALVGQVSTWSQEDGDWSVVWGWAGAGVERVVVDREVGGPVTATVTDGWFAAWWPTQAQAATLTPYAADGTAGPAVAGGW
ncbi:hypothetical protein [Cellulomonas endophytica]|uniref:hypothetical protein n=1 Tax=Cellulomonas endophytica TaxID=2494735 RepID=UPI001F0C2AC7|nr:hypothetical protein [Cellulomonas endophytica]